MSEANSLDLWVLLEMIGLVGALCCILFVSALLALALLGFAWSPLAALICRRLAVNCGLAPGNYARLGAVYSLHLFLPWVYLASYMRGTRIARPLIVGVYVVLLGGWFCVSILGNIAVGALFLAEYISNPEKYQFHPYTYMFIIVMLSLPFAINVVLWARSAGSLRRQDAGDQAATGTIGIDSFGSRAIPVPFIVVWVVLSSFLGVVLYYTGLNSGEANSLALLFPPLLLSLVLVLALIAYFLVRHWLIPRRSWDITASLNSEGTIILDRTYLRPFPDALMGTVLSLFALPAVLSVTFFGSL